MAKTKISEFSATPGNNTDIDGINIAEGCAPSGINDAIRELMAQLKDFQTGAAGDSFNGPVGTTTAVAGAFTTLSASSTTTLSGLTASTALALDASKNVVSVTNTGTGNNVLATSPTLVTPALGTPSSATLTNATGLPISTGVSGLGTGIATALAVNVGTAGAPVVNGGALGTPSSGTVTNLTGTASININGTVGATTPTTGAFTDLTFSGSGTVSGGTANGVAYLNGSKVLTTGSALTFDGTNLGVKQTTPTNYWVDARQLVIGDNSSGVGLTIAPSSTTNGNIYFAKSTTGGQAYQGYITYGMSTDSLQFAVNQSEQMRLTSTGLGIGTSSPSTYSAKLAVVGTSYFAGGASSTEQARFGYTDGTSYWGMGRDNVTTGNFIINNAGTTVATFSTSGNLGLGVTPSAWYSSVKAFQIGAATSLWASTSNGNFGLTANEYLDSSAVSKRIVTDYATRYQQYSGQHVWYNAASAAAGSTISWTQAMTLDASGSLLVGRTARLNTEKFSVLQAAGSDGIALTDATNATAFLSIVSAGTALNTNGALLFGTGSSYTERARIDSSGNLLVGTTSSTVSDSAGVRARPDGTLQATRTASTDAVSTMDVYSTGAGTYRFYVGMGGTVYATSTSISAISDATLKENVRDLETGLTEVMALKPRRFDWINGDAQNVAGFVAQEVEQVLPELVTDYVYNKDDNGNDIIKKSLKMGDILPTLVNAIQEQQAQIAQLTQRLAAAGIA